MTKTLKRIGPLQLGKILGALYFLFGLIVGVIAGSIALISLIVKPLQNGGLDAGLGLLFLLIAPFLYGAMGFLSDVVSAALYNFLAKFVGGIEVDLE